ncbi:hypothetical protein A2U01_0059058, partial [Trifolium medium]|nr:hypothetical protein [Trifolium medium]
PTSVTLVSELPLWVANPTGYWGGVAVKQREHHQIHESTSRTEEEAR